MRNLICCLFLLGAGLAAQSSSEDEPDPAAVAKLNSILLTLHREASASTSIVEVLESAGIGTYRFKESVARAKQALISLGLTDWKAQGIAERLRMVGKEVRGPDDTPVQMFRLRPR